ncbi:MAG: SRPBCC family protein [bacterium]
MVTFSQSIAIKAPIQRVYEVISDFARYPDFLEEIEGAEVVSSGKNKARVAFALNLMTKVHYTLDFKLKPPSSIKWTLVEGEFMKGNDGSWELASLENNLTDAKFSTEVEFPFWVPKSMAEEVLSSGMPKMLEGFKREAERGAAT